MLLKQNEISEMLDNNICMICGNKLNCITVDSNHLLYECDNINCHISFNCIIEDDVIINFF